MRATLTALALLLAMPAHAGSDVTISNEPCCEEQRAAAALSVEGKVIATIPEQAFRENSVLWLRLGGNRSAQIVDCTAFICSVENFRRHNLVAWWPKQRYYVIDVGLYEGRYAFLVSERDGRSTPVFAPPVLSPTGRYAVAADLSPAYGNGLQIIDMSLDPPSALEVVPQPTCSGNKAMSLRPTPVWLDDSRVAFEGKPFFDNDDPREKQVFRIVDGKPEWEC